MGRKAFYPFPACTLLCRYMPLPPASLRPRSSRKTGSGSTFRTPHRQTTSPLCPVMIPRNPHQPVTFAMSLWLGSVDGSTKVTRHAGGGPGLPALRTPHRRLPTSGAAGERVASLRGGQASSPASRGLLEFLRGRVKARCGQVAPRAP